MKFKVFISYSTYDLQLVDRIKNYLSDTPIEVFIAEYAVQPGNILAENINKAIMECDLFIILWSQNAKHSDWVSQEIGKATTLNKKILPLILDESSNLPGFINNLKYISVYKYPDNALIEAKKIVEDEYNKKLRALQQHQKKDNDLLIALGLGALVIWIINQKPNTKY